MIANNWNEAKVQVDAWKFAGLKVVFTNGCFDILHRGHVEYLADAKLLGSKLVLALNSDRSVRELKGAHRPIQTQDDRAAILDALESIDLVVVFDEDTPAKIIQ
ncbi:MAG: adenylyltransferase/cytidyltransferase family protein, partial [Candidatus Marinimicrobia bacterium]|nr:adenylyltransferase/cytidyltransferase family protein [Candidatus Neomarinimicrobiota bacterium]